MLSKQHLIANERLKEYSLAVISDYIETQFAVSYVTETVAGHVDFMMPVSH